MGKESPELIRVEKPERRSLLERYDIPVEHLSYEYISECTSSKILERIVLILRSGEEGVYPDLTSHAEKRLAVIKPNSVVLRKAEPIVKRCMLDAHERNEIESDISHWMSEMKCREKDLQEGKSALLSDPYPQPAIRQTKDQPKAQENNVASTTKSRRISSCDYAAWDKYDVDTEINKIDIREEQQRVELKNIQRKQKQSLEKQATKDVIINKSSLTATELGIMAEQEKEKGNEAFRASDYQEALKHYNLSISIDPNLTAYNNRAVTYIKLQRYEAALDDCNTVLSTEHTNIKGLLRRALSLEHLERRSQALADYETVLRLEPTNKLAIAGVKKLKKPGQSRKVRMVIEEKCSSGDEATANSESEAQQCAENNGISMAAGEARPICFCDRAPGPSQIAKPRPHFKAEYCLEYQSGDALKSKRFTETSKSNGSFPHATTGFPKTPVITKPSKNGTDSMAKFVKNKSIFSCNASNGFKERSSVIIEEITTEPCDDVLNKKCLSERNGSGDRRVECSVQDTNNEERSVDTRHKNRTDSSLEKIQVADKYENKSNKHLENDDSQRTIINSPYEFMHMWHSLKNDTDYKSYADLLRSLNTDKLTTVFRSELDGPMLNRILQCLERHFCTGKDTELLLSLLKSISSASRFAIVHMFMNADDKRALEKVFNYLEKQGVSDVSDLRQLYRI